MKIKELIEKLKKFDPETLVVVDGYEGGLEDINNIEEKSIILKLVDYEGKYSDEYNKDCKRINAILLSRHKDINIYIKQFNNSLKSKLKE